MSWEMCSLAQISSMRGNVKSMRDFLKQIFEIFWMLETYDCMWKESFKVAAGEKITDSYEENDAIDLSQTSKVWGKKKRGTNFTETSEKLFTFLRVVRDGGWRGEKKNVIKDIPYEISSKKPEQKNLNISEYPPTPRNFFSYFFLDGSLCRNNT